MKILYEDNHLIAVDKPAGLLVQGDSTGRDTLFEQVKAYLKERYSKPGNVYLGLVHRLDRQVSGVVLFAKTSKAASRLFNEFYHRRAVKLYAALAHAAPGPAANPKDWTALTQMLARSGNTTVVTRRSDDAREASLFYRMTMRNDAYALIMVRLLTGRKHQIRAQLSSIGFPIVGDTRYGSGETVEDGAICLHARCLRVAHPVSGDEITIIAELPERITRRIGPAAATAPFLDEIPTLI